MYGLGFASPWGDIQTAQEARWSPQELLLTRQQVLEQQRGIGYFGAPPDMFGSVASGMLSDVVIVAESQVTPPVTYDPSSPSAPPPREPGPAGWLADSVLRNVVRPSVKVVSKSTGRVLLVAEPYGPPVVNLFPWLVGGSAVAGGVAGWLIWRGLTRTKARVSNPKRRRGRRRRSTRRRGR